MIPEFLLEFFSVIPEHPQHILADEEELVVFLRPVIIKDPSLNGDFSSLRSMLPGENFFAQPPEAQPFNNLPYR